VRKKREKGGGKSIVKSKEEEDQKDLGRILGGFSSSR
jgi:hypothetical protein